MEVFSISYASPSHAAADTPMIPTGFLSNIIGSQFFYIGPGDINMTIPIDGEYIAIGWCGNAPGGAGNVLMMRKYGDYFLNQDIGYHMEKIEFNKGRIVLTSSGNSANQKSHIFWFIVFYLDKGM